MTTLDLDHGERRRIEDSAEPPVVDRRPIVHEDDERTARRSRRSRADDHATCGSATTRRTAPSSRSSTVSRSTVRKGEIHGLIGESGSGKTQTAFAVLGLLPRGGT